MSFRPLPGSATGPFVEGEAKTGESGERHADIRRVKAAGGV